MRTEHKNWIAAGVAIGIFTGCTIDVPPMIAHGTIEIGDGGAQPFIIQIRSAKRFDADAGSPDAAAPDAARVDATIALDASATDALPRDSGSSSSDAGANLDASATLGTNLGEVPYYGGQWARTNLWDQGRPFTDAYGAVAIVGRRDAGRYIVTWDGTGSITEIFGVRISSTTRRAEFDLGAPSETHGIVRATGTISNVRIVRLADENAGPWFPPFVANLAPYKVLRFMDWNRTNGSSETNWADRVSMTRTHRYDGGRVPYEDQLDLAIATRTIPWITIPHLTTDAYALELARLIKSRYPSGPIYVEWSNEVWNDQFPQAQYARTEGTRLGLSTDANQARLLFQVRRSREVWSVMRGEIGERMIRVIGGQQGNTWAANQLLGACSGDCDALAIAPYFYATTTASVDQTLQWAREMKAVTDARGVRLIAYEGGQHLSSPCESANRDPNMGALYSRLIAGWFAIGNVGPLVLFNAAQRFGTWGCWGAREYETQTGAPKAAAIEAWRP